MQALSLNGVLSRPTYSSTALRVPRCLKVPQFHQQIRSRRQRLGAKDDETVAEVAGNRENTTKDESKANSDTKTEEPRAEPKTSSEAINWGLELFGQAEYEKAIEAFTSSLELPGKGAVRESGRAKEYSCPSESEENSALYNMACCYCKLGKIESALACMEGLFDNGYDDFDQIRKDPDLEEIKGSQRLEDMIQKAGSLSARVMKTLGKKGYDSNKPWLTW